MSMHVLRCGKATRDFELVSAVNSNTVHNHDNLPVQHYRNTIGESELLKSATSGVQRLPDLHFVSQKLSQ